jgi:Concanavalin A-like lectin/glucanases superfamily
VRTLKYAGLCLFAVAVAASCGSTTLVASGGSGGSTGVSSTSTGSAHACVPGVQVACACPGGQPAGVQVCTSNGASYGACSCGGQGGASTSSTSHAVSSTAATATTSTGTGGAEPGSALTQDLIVHYAFDESSGMVAHESTGLGTDAVLYNFPNSVSQWVPGVIGGALSFGGATSMEYAIAPDYVKPTTSMTVSAWAFANTSAVWGMVVQNWGSPNLVGQFHFGLESSVGNLSVHFNGAPALTTESSGLFPTGGWHHVAFVADFVQQSVTLYLDGQPTGPPGPFGGALLSPPMQSLGIGVHTGDTGLMPAASSSGFWDGMIDDIGIWTRALGPAEIALIQQAGLVGVGITEIGTLASGAACTTSVVCASGTCAANACK